MNEVIQTRRDAGVTWVTLDLSDPESFRDQRK